MVNSRDARSTTYLVLGGVSLELKRNRNSGGLGPHLELQVRSRSFSYNYIQTDECASPCRMYHYHSQPSSLVSVSPSQDRATHPLPIEPGYSVLQGLRGRICRRSILL
jgi:hypothetical protein